MLHVKCRETQRRDLHREAKSSVLASLGSPDKMPTGEQPLELTGCFWKASRTCVVCVHSAQPLSLLLGGSQGYWVQSAPNPLPHRHSCYKGIEILAKAQFCPQEAGVVEEPQNPLLPAT